MKLQKTLLPLISVFLLVGIFTSDVVRAQDEAAPPEAEEVKERTGETIDEKEKRLIREAFERRTMTGGFVINKQEGVEALGGFVLSPGSYYEIGDPGDTIEVTLTLLNKSGKDVVYEIAQRDVAVTDTGGPSFMGGGIKGPFPALEWLKPAVRVIPLHHGERAYIPVRIKIPERADAGDHMAGLLFKQADLVNRPEAGVKINSYTSVLFVITVNGDVETGGRLVGLSPSRFINWKKDVDLILRAENTGSVHLSPEGVIKIKNIFGVEVDDYEVQNFHVLRGSSKNKTFNWKPKFALGRYTAHSNLSLKTPVNTLPATQVSTSFWVIPLVPLIILILAIFLVSYLVQLFFSRFEIKAKKDGDSKKE